MSRSCASKFLALKLVALAAICSVGLIAMPGVASAAAGDCVVYDNQGDHVTSISAVAGSSTELVLFCAGSAPIDSYTVDNTASTGYFDDGGNSGPGTSVDDAPGVDTELHGHFIASSDPAGQYPDSFTFTASNGVDTFPLVTVNVLVTPAPPVCTITANDGQSVAQGTDATPVAFTCSNNGDGPITFETGGAGFGSAALDANGTSLDYTANAHESGTDTVELYAHTDNSTALPTTFTFVVTDAPPACTTINDTMQGGQDEQLLVDYTAACSDANGDTLSYVVNDSTGASGTLDDGNPGIYNESSDHFEDTTPFTDTFQVTVSDGNPANDTNETVHILVTPNHPPTCTVVSGDDHQSVAHNGDAIAIRIVCADQDTSFLPQNDEFSVWFDPNALSTQGFARLNDNSNTITYTPNWNGLGPDTIALLVTQNTDGAQQSTLLVHLDVTDTAPACGDASLSMTNDSSDSADLACTDADGDFVDYNVDQAPRNGTVYQSGTIFYYTPNSGFVGTDTFTVLADDGAKQTPITITAHVAAAPPVVVAPVIVPVVTPPLVTPPAVVPPVVIVTPPAPTLSSPVTVKGGILTLALGCADATTSCKASVGLSTTIAGKTVSLGSKSITIKPGTDGTLKVTLSGAARKALKAFAGKTITVKVAVKTTNPKTGKTTTATKALKVKVPR
ncbi:MAG: hypothetical protein QOC73_1136 [Actinomycetota bacterium]|nr:hypothetical protein [Actinomycetota bacterium]